MVLSAAPALCSNRDFTFKKQDQVLVPKHTEENEIATVAHILQSISTLEGITYYSQRRKRDTVLYPHCYMVDGPQSRKKLPDSYGHMNDPSPSYYLQDDSSLGAAVYEAVFLQDDQSAGMDVYNFDPLKMGLIVLVPSRGMHLRVSVRDKGDVLEVDVLMEAALGRSNFAANYMNRSLQARFEAVFRWFESMYSKEV
jgi:hypothetical protein